MLPHLRSLLIYLAAVAVAASAAAWPQAEQPESSERIAALRVQEARYWKGNLHTHSLWSDGDDFPEMIADWYRRHDYHFLALTDHNVLSEGERWINVDPSTTPRRREAFRKYLARFGDRWVERRVMD